MNWQHLRAFFWLRWRLMVNHWSRAGRLNAVLMVLLTIGALLTAIPLFVASFLLGQYAIPRAAPVHLLFAWDAVIVGFLFFWTIGVVTDLQRTEPLSLSKFLHLPVSANGAFLINYFSSLLRLSLIVFVPAMLGFCMALISANGMRFLPVLPSLAAFLLMVTALTYQLQGWLSSLMTNPRRRRSVVMAMTAVLILVSQLPNLVNVFAPWEKQPQAEQSGKFQIEVWGRTARLVNLAVPVGWLPLGVMSAAEGRVTPSILGLLGMTLIGTASLWKAYRSTVGHYQGQSSSRKRRTTVTASSVPAAMRPGSLFLEWRLLGFSEPVSAIALAGLRSLVRSPEGKMMLLTPLIMAPIFGSMLWRGRQTIPEFMRPLVASGGMAVVLLGLVQMMGNVFGFDRDGFRVFVLSAAPRRDILLGKNMSLAPVALGLGAILLPVLQFACPMRPDHFLAMIPQYVSMYLLFCIVTNLLSIYTPVHLNPGTLKPSNLKITTLLLQVLMSILLFPLTQAVALLPLGIELVTKLLGWAPGVPICLVLSLAECAVVTVIYRLALEWQGNALQSREQRILESVTNRAA